MKRKICIALLAAGFTSSALAGEQSSARLVGVVGNVLVSNDQNIASAGEAFRLQAGMRVLVTLNSAATIEYSSGCRVRLAAGERLEVRDTAPCNGRGFQPVVLAPLLGGRK